MLAFFSLGPGSDSNSINLGFRSNCCFVMELGKRSLPLQKKLLKKSIGHVSLDSITDRFLQKIYLDGQIFLIQN